MKTKKAFREYLNEMSKNAPLWKHFKNRGQRTRPYGDYLYSADREMFNVEYQEWLKKGDNLMKLKTTNKIIDTSFQGYLTITFKELIDTLGDPHRTDSDKVTDEWAFVSDGIVFTIYDYKEERTPLHSYAWHIGGLDKNVLAVVQKLFPNHTVRGNR